ncbi:hypothetical protein [Hymenobacter armeniacus]|uniref:Uncharacterized protein n=1 Tax=Hymenobacter armeniacus TaxID=2771358 RepID=A0ABR8JM61_9BACT|nr:hypothetical protein [Hymenobacter armeniacus]MBD2721073.1 hypothetical protein [Hymenobacter armeniacus]
MKATPNSEQYRPQPAQHAEPAIKAHAGTPRYGTFGRPAEAPAPPPDPAREAAAALIAEGGPEAQLHAAYAVEDSRYAGGDVFDLQNEQTGL